MEISASLTWVLGLHLSSRRPVTRVPPRPPTDLRVTMEAVLLMSACTQGYNNTVWRSH